MAQQIKNAAQKLTALKPPVMHLVGKLMPRTNLQTTTMLVMCTSILLSQNAFALTAAWQQSVLNDSVFYDPNAISCSDSNLVGANNIQKAFNFFVGKDGLTPTQVAGIIGNLYAESGLNPGAQENGSTSPTPINGVGFGIAQWTYTSRQAPLVTLAQSEGVAPNTLGVQLNYIWEELQGTPPAENESKALSDLKQQTTISGAATTFMVDYEGPAIDNGAARTQYAQSAYDQYASANGSSVNSASACTSSSVACNNATPSASNSSLSATQQKVVCIAEQELSLWQSGQLTPANGYFKYSENRTEEWCADFASWVYSQAGDPIQTPNWNVASVAALQTLAQNSNGKFTWHNASGYTPVAGNLAIHGSNHVNIVTNVSGPNMTLVGGDQGPGPYPGGSSVTQYNETISSGITSDGITGYITPN